MATTITFNTSSPHSLVLTIAGNGGAQTETRANVLAACAAGPLKAVLTATADWTIFNLGAIGSRCNEIHVRTVINRTGAGTSGVASPGEFFWTATGIKCNCTNTQQIEIRKQHSERF